MGAVQLVGGNREQVDAESLYVDRQLSHGLGGVAVEEDVPFPADGADLVQGLHGADLVVGRHNGNEHGVVADLVRDGFRFDASVTVYRQDGDVETAPFQRFARIQDGVVFGGLGDDVPALLAAHGSHPLDGQVVGFRRAAGEDNVPRVGADQVRNLLPGPVHRGFSGPTETVSATGRIAEIRLEIGHHRVQLLAWIHLRRGLVVHIYGRHIGLIAFKKRCHKCVRFEVAQIVLTLAQADHADRETQFVGDRNDDAAFGRPVQFGQNQAGNADVRVELPGLGHGILSGGRVQNQQGLVRGAGDAFAQDTVNFLEFLHQIDAGVESPRGVDDDDVHIAGPGGGEGVERYGGGVRARPMANDVGAGTFGPDRKLVYRGGPERIACGQKHPPAPRAVPACQLSDRGRLSRSVDTGHQDDVRPGPGGAPGKGVARSGGFPSVRFRAGRGPSLPPLPAQVLPAGAREDGR